MKPVMLPVLFGAVCVVEIAAAVGFSGYRQSPADAVLGWLFAFAASVDAYWSKKP